MTTELETDPNGTNQHESGAKLDAGKNRMGLVLGDFANALIMVSEVGTAGANKYTDHGWKNVPQGIERYTDAMQRHYFKECTGEILDPELSEMAGKNIYHAACTAWNTLARLELMLIEIKPQIAPPKPSSFRPIVQANDPSYKMSKS